MSQVFQVLRCYKCSIFQVHQTKKNNKWICKVCGEKQSVKRHYGLGTAQECRIHVQKLNTINGDRNESILKLIDSDDSNPDDDTENIINFNQESQRNPFEKDNILKPSKWTTYVENEVTSEETDSMYIDNTEAISGLPLKRKINRKNKLFKVPKVSSKYNNSENIASSSEKPNKSNQFFTSTELSSDITNQIHLRREHHNQIKIEDSGKSTKLVTINKKDSKWAQFIESSDNFVTQDSNSVENINNEAEHIEDIHNNYNAKPYYDKNHCEYDVNNDCQSIFKNINRNSLFSQCDDKDLDNILDL